jgi:hypothetical protein
MVLTMVSPKPVPREARIAAELPRYIGSKI